MMLFIILLLMLFAYFLLLIPLQSHPRFAWVMERVRMDTPLLLFANEEDDSDIKIAGAPSEAPADEAALEAEELRRQKENGSLDHARTLGKLLSKDIVRIDGEEAFGQDARESGAVRIQRRLLLAFAASHGVETFVANKLVAKAALNAFYDTLQKEQPAFYDDLNGSGAFSFYVLCVRRGGSVEKEIGKTFAMLAGKEGDDVLAALGEALFIRFTDVIRGAIASVGLGKPAEEPDGNGAR